MDGGRAQLRKPTYVNEDELPPVPDAVLLFREIINQLKENIWLSLEKKGDQDPEHVDGALKRIQQLGNTLRYMVYADDPGTQNAIELVIQQVGESALDTLTSLEDMFRDKGVQFEQMTAEERRLCEHYIQNDIGTFPYSVNTAHINSMSKNPALGR
jgi:hypothetical protein